MVFLTLTIIGTFLYFHISKITNYMYYLQFFTLMFTMLNLFILAFFPNKAVELSILLVNFLFLIYVIKGFMHGIIRLSFLERYVDYYQSAFMFVIPTILTLVLIIKNNKGGSII